jgi:site-specific DNA-adenine methylase
MAITHYDEHFIVADFRSVIVQGQAFNVIYTDPPYPGHHPNHSKN